MTAPARWSWWLGAVVELITTPFKENNPLLGLGVLVFLVVEAMALVHLVAALEGWR